MAQIDTSIAMGFRPVQIESPINQMAAMAQLEGMQQQRQQNALKMQEYQRGMQQRNALAAIHADPNVKVGTPEYLTRVQQEAPDLYPDVAARALQQAELNEKIEERAYKNVDRRLGLFKSIVPNINSEGGVYQYIQAAYSDPDLKPILEKIQPLEAALESNVAAFYKDPDEWRMRASGVSAEKLAEIAREKSKPIVVSPGGRLVSPKGEELFAAPSKETESDLARLQRERAEIVAVNANDPRVKDYDARISKLITPAEHLSDLARKQGELEELEAQLAKDPTNKKLQQRIKEYKSDIRKDTEWKPSVVVQGPALSKDALDLAADQFLVTGTIPPVNRGDRSVIINRAAAMAREKGMDPSVVDRMANKSNQAALTQLTKQETMVGAFEKNFVKNVGIVERISQKKDTTGVPLLQKWINVGKKAVSGDPELASLAVAIKAVQNEYGKIVSGSMGNTAVAVSEIKRMEDLLNAAQTPQDVMAVLNTMREETQNRMAGFKEQKAELTGAIRGTTKPPANAVAPYTDAEKERRYQEWKANQGKAK